MAIDSLQKLNLAKTSCRSCTSSHFCSFYDPILRCIPVVIHWSFIAATKTWTYHLPPESCTENAWNCDRPPAPCFEGTPLGAEDFQPHVPWGHENCMGVQLSEDGILSRCLTPERIRTIWVVGDSHSFALVPCITTTAETVGMPVHNYSWPAHHACDMDWSKLLNVLEARVNPGDIVAFAGCFYCMQWCQGLSAPLLRI